MEQRERLVRLKRLAREVERLPPSRARDLLLREVRTRAVALETGESGRGRRWASSDDHQLDRLLSL